ncbi:MAG: helix-turn-helix transcriptional regulator [Ruminococcus sp.]|jgi:transcriptional regulator with XRE-family HTH domain|nr:helix-turn-helix transcriptional regulator [Ruminococcus sp.]
MTRDKDIGKILRSRRLELGMTQEQVALKLGMSIHQYQRYEYGEHRFPNIPMRIGLRVCTVLELDPFELLPFSKDE